MGARGGNNATTVVDFLARVFFAINVSTFSLYPASPPPSYIIFCLTFASSSSSFFPTILLRFFTLLPFFSTPFYSHYIRYNNRPTSTGMGAFFFPYSLANVFSLVFLRTFVSYSLIAIVYDRRVLTPVTLLA